jgi:AcrR family transcriptional regulator
MPRPVASEQERAEQRQRIRRAASELHREGGVRSVTVRAVAKRAGVSTGLLYRYFSNLSDLMRSLWQVPIAELGRSLAAVELAEADPIERIERLLVTYADFTVAHDETHRGLLLFVRPPGSTPDTSTDPDNLLLFASLVRAVEEGQTARRVRDDDPRMLAQLLWSGVHGALALPINIDTFALANGRTMAAEMIAALTRSITTEEPA